MHLSKVNLYGLLQQKWGKLFASSSQRLSTRISHPEAVSFNKNLVKLMLKGEQRKADDLFFYIRKTGRSVDLFTYCLLIRGKIKNGELSQAEMLVKDMVKANLTPDQITCNMLLNYYCRHKKDEVYQILEFMRLKGIKIDFSAMYIYNSPLSFVNFR